MGPPFVSVTSVLARAPRADGRTTLHRLAAASSVLGSISRTLGVRPDRCGRRLVRRRPTRMLSLRRASGRVSRRVHGTGVRLLRAHVRLLGQFIGEVLDVLAVYGSALRANE